MKHLLIALLVIATAPLAHAQTAKVIKVKGQQAIVQFPSGTVPQVGQQLDVGNGGGSSAAPAGVAPGSGSRANVIGLGINQLYFLKNSQTSTSRTGLGLNGRYGWNTGNMEFGPIGRLEYESQDNASTTIIGAGGFFDYNFSPNVSGQRLIYLATADLMYGQRNNKSGSVETTTTLFDLFIGGGVKWFGLSDSFCLRADAGFNMQRSTPESGSATNNTGLMIRAGIANYF